LWSASRKRRLRRCALRRAVSRRSRSTSTRAASATPGTRKTRASRVRRASPSRTDSRPRGDYSLFILYTRTGYALIVNRGTGQWGTDHDGTKDIGRIALTTRTMAEPEPSLSIYLVPDAPQPGTGYAELKGTLRIKWGATELTTGWRVDQ